MIQKFFFISSDIFSDKTFNGIVEVFDEIIEEGLRASCILEYIECLISILSTTASTTQSASETTEKSSSIFPVLINSALVFSTSSGQVVSTLQGIPERLRIHSAGTVNIPAGVTLGQTASSTAAANTLDDYEEGLSLIHI